APPAVCPRSCRPPPPRRRRGRRPRSGHRWRAGCPRCRRAAAWSAAWRRPQPGRRGSSRWSPGHCRGCASRDGGRLRLATLWSMAQTVAVLQGDQTGQELLDQALRVVDPGVIGVDLDLQRFDLSLDNRRATGNQVVLDAADAMVACGFGLKAATVTPEGRGDVGSPNALLRERVGGK